jgi:hypothetical protein
MDISSLRVKVQDPQPLLKVGVPVPRQKGLTHFKQRLRKTARKTQEDLGIGGRFAPGLALTRLAGGRCRLLAAG